MKEPKVEVLPIEKGATPDPQNVNKHTQRGRGLHENSMRKRGVGRSIFSAGKGVDVPVVMGGNQTLEIAAQLGLKVINVHTKGNEIINHVRDDIAPGSPDFYAMAIEDNEVSKQSYNPDIDILAAVMADPAMQALKDEDKILAGIVEGMGLKAETQDAEPQIDRAAELLEKWQVKTGDLWQIGEHRLICGDCTDAAVVARVMGKDKADMTFIDPPYNALKSWNKDEAHSETRLDPAGWFENDNLEWDEYWLFIENLFKALQGHSVYVCCDYRIYAGIREQIEKTGYQIKHCIVWKKNVWGLGKRYRFQHEFIVYACKKDAPFYGGHDQSDVWELDIHKTTEHKTPKPVELPKKAIRNSSQDNEIVFDGCNGFGTVMVACQNLGRRGRAIEISPAYCAVTLERMSQAFPALEIKRLE